MRQLCLEPRFDPIYKLRNRILSIDAALRIEAKDTKTQDCRLRLAMRRARLVQRVKELQ